MGIVLLLAVWWVSTTSHENSAFPNPVKVARSVVDAGWGFYSANIGSTLGRAGWGYLIGNLVALALASIVLVFPRLEEMVSQMGVITNCLPITAVGPLVMIIFGSRVSAIVLSAMLVFFTTLVGALVGLKSASRTMLDAISAYGGSSWTQVWKVRLIAALPSVFSALQVAIPGSVLGAIVGEYLGGIDTGIGVALNAAQRQVQPERVWALSIITGLISLFGYGLVGLIGRCLKVNTMIGKRPWDVYRFLFVGGGAAQNRQTLGADLLVTVRDAGIGYVAGLLTAFILALLFCFSPILENIIMPTAMVLRSIPLVVMTPLITLIMGIGQKSVTTLVIIVVFLPALANILYGLRNVSGEHRDVIRAFGGNALTLLLKVSLPGSIPSLFASARVSIPSAVVGAMIAEWLSTGEGLGGSISKAVAAFSYSRMWASAVTIALVTMVAYSVMSIIDDLVARLYEQD